MAGSRHTLRKKDTNDQRTGTQCRRLVTFPKARWHLQGCVSPSIISIRRGISVVREGFEESLGDLGLSGVITSVGAVDGRSGPFLKWLNQLDRKGLETLI
jgi:hypothetical protein